MSNTLDRRKCAQYAISPIVHVADFVLIEKDSQRSRRVLPMIREDLLLNSETQPCGKLSGIG